MMSTYVGYAERRTTPLMGLAIAILVGQLLALVAVTWSAELMIGFAAIAGLTLAVLSGRAAKIYILIVLTPIAANFYGFVFDFSWTRGVDRLALYPWFAVVAMLAIFAEHAAEIRKYNFATPVDYVMALIVFWAAVTLVWAPNFLHSLLSFFQLFSGVLLFYLAATILKDAGIHRKAVNVFIATGAAVAALSIFSLHFLDHTVFWSYALTDSISFDYAIKTSPQRAKAVMNPNSTALFLNLCLAFSFCSYAWTNGHTSRSKRIIYFLLSLFLVIGILETKSKGGVGSMIIMVLFFLIAIRTLRRQYFTNAAICLFFLVAVFVTQTASVGTTPRVLGTQEGSLGDRVEIWTLGGELLMSESGGWGLGVGGFTEYADPIPHAHSLYFSTLFDLGPVGVVLLFALISVLAIKTVSMLRYQDSYPQMMVVAGAGGAIVIAVHGLVDGSYRDPLIWMFLGIVVATLSLVDREITGRDLAS